MNTSKTLLYDGSFNGFLTSVFIAFEEKIDVVDIQRNSRGQNELFSDTTTIFTHVEKAKRVWNGIRAKSHNAITNVYFAFLSEMDGVELLLFSYIQKLMATKNGSHTYTEEVMRIGQLARSVRREKQRMESFVRFGQTADKVKMAIIEPDYDVLPLISKYVRNRFPNEPWLVYDMKRKYGIFYNLEYVELISLNLSNVPFTKVHKGDAFLGEGHDYQTLLTDYFKMAPLIAHINGKLHVQRSPKKYPKYLREKKEIA